MLSTTFPQIITHEKVLVDCDAEFDEFVKTMDILGPKLGPMVFQFPSFDRWKFPKQDSSLGMLTPFLICMKQLTSSLFSTIRMNSIDGTCSQSIWDCNRSNKGTR